MTAGPRSRALVTRVSSSPPAGGRLLQRRCACGRSGSGTEECRACRGGAPLHRAPVSGLGTMGARHAPQIVHEVLHTPGEPLDAATREFFETRFDHDFRRVRVHADARATASAAAVDALGYTVGPHVVLRADRFALATASGRGLLAHELAHVVQQDGNGSSVRPDSISSPDDGSEREAARAADAVAAGRSFRPSMLTGPAVHRQPAPAPPATLAGLTATREAFNNAGAPEAANCATSKPAALGVDGPAVGQNGMELIFKLNGAIPPGTEFDITRTKATGLWQFDGGVWLHLGGWPAGSSDDHHDQDECLTPMARRIFVVDTPGLPGTLDPTGIAFPSAGAVAATATAAVWKLSFAEWVIARNRPLGIGWTRISTPVFHRWHSIFSAALVGGVWKRVDTPGGQHNEIELGSTGTTGATP